MEYIEHVSYPGFGWIDPIQDQDCPLVAEETAAAFIEYCESLRQQLAAALAACEVKDAALKDTLYFLERHSNRWDGVNGKHPQLVVDKAREALAVQPDASIRKYSENIDKKLEDT